MLEVCFSDSVKAAIRVAQILDKNSAMGGAASVAIIGRSRLWALLHPRKVKREKRRYERERRELAELIMPLESRYEDILGIDFMLDVGDIKADIKDGACPRKDVIFRWLTANPWGDLPDMKSEAEVFWNSSIQALGSLRARARGDEKIRVWVDDSPASLCGLMFIADILLKSGCEVILARAPKSFFKGDGSLVEYRGWGDIPPELFGKFSAMAESLSEDELKAMVKGWEILKKTNAPLRVMDNKVIKSAKEDFYDGVILSFLEGSMKVGEVIGRALGEGNLLVSDWLIAERIKALIDSGTIVVISPDTARFYGTVIKKA